MKRLDTGLLDKAPLVISDTLYVGSSPNDLAIEIATNTWLISLSEEESNTFTADDLRTFLAEVAANRQQQLDHARAGHGMIFYCWFDEQACQLRFSLISDYHDHLPFGCQVRVVDTPDSIINTFLEHPCHGGIPVPGVVGDANRVPSSTRGEPSQPYILDVYCRTLHPRLLSTEEG